MPSTVIGLTANIKSETAVERMICRWEIDSSVPQPKPKLCSKFKTNMCHRRRTAKIRPIHVFHPCAPWGPAIGRGWVVWNRVHATEVRGASLIPADLTWKKNPSWPWVWWRVAVWTHHQVHKRFPMTLFRATSTSFGNGQCPKLQKKVEKRILIIMEGSVLLFKNGNWGVIVGQFLFRLRFSCLSYCVLPLSPSIMPGDGHYLKANPVNCSRILVSQLNC